MSERDEQLAMWTREKAKASLYPFFPVRKDCAFCGRERSTRDDNHAPDCCYWDFFQRGDQ